MESSEFLWQERGWQQELKEDGTIYRGAYRVSLPGEKRFYPGGIIERTLPALKFGDDIGPSERKEFDVYIFSPPAELKHHLEAKCFQSVSTKSDVLKVHYNRPPETVDAAITHLEKVLHEAFELAMQTQSAANE